MPIDNSTRFPKPLAADLRELSEGMAIVIDGDTAPKAIASGQYLFIKNHSTLATGGYHATAAIASGADITSSNVAPDADGIVNGAVSSLSDQIATVSEQLTPSTNTFNLTSNFSSWGASYTVVGGFCYISILHLTYTNSGNNQTLATGLPKALLQSMSTFGGADAAATAIVQSCGHGFWITADSTTLNCHIGSSDPNKRPLWVYAIYPVHPDYYNS